MNLVLANGVGPGDLVVEIRSTTRGVTNAGADNNGIGDACEVVASPAINWGVLTGSFR